MNEILILTARSRAHKVIQDDKVLRRARAFNTSEATPKKVARTISIIATIAKPVTLHDYTVIMRSHTRGMFNTHEKKVEARNLRDARATGRAMAAAFGFYYITTKLAAEYYPTAQPPTYRK